VFPLTLLKPNAAPTVREIFDDHAVYVWRTFLDLGVPAVDVPDLCHEVFAAVHGKLGEHAERASLASWLDGISLRVASDYWRRADVRDRRGPEDPPAQLAAARGRGAGANDPPSENELERLGARLARMLDTSSDGSALPGWRTIAKVGGLGVVVAGASVLFALNFGPHTPRPPDAPEAAAVPVETEAETLAHARVALEGDPALALALTDEHRTAFPTSALAQERDAIAIQALKRLGRMDEAAKQTTDFARHYPNAALP
jgi:hypothetical protein